MDDLKGRDEVYSEKIRAGKRTYFFDVRSTRSNDYYITITESKRRYNGRGYDKHKIFLYKEDFNKFLTSLNKTVDHVKSELMPDYDYDEFTRRPQEGEEGGEDQYAPSAAMDAASDSADTVELDSDESSDLEMDTEELSTSWED
jgi:hypothetical protein